MILIAHRGNINGPKPELENTTDYIINAINQKFEVEVDIWLINNVIYFGHDEPTHKPFKKFFDYHDKIWFHAKNIEALHYMVENKFKKYFWHQNDNYTLTSNNYIWTFPGCRLTSKSIAVMPEPFDYSEIDLVNCYGICSDYIINYK